MTINEAREIIADMKLELVHFNDDGMEVLLDGYFKARDVEAILTVLRAYEQHTPTQPNTTSEA